MSKLRKMVKGRPGTFIFHGVPGVGKSALCSRFKDPVYVVDPQEDGVLDLQATGIVDEKIQVYEVEDWVDYLNTLSELVSSKRKTVVIETLGGIEAMLFNYAYRELQYDSWKKFEGFAEGARASQRWVRDMLGVLGTLRDSGKTIVITAHSLARKYSNPLGSDYDRVYPELSRQTWGTVAKWAQNVFYMALEVTAEKDKGDITARGKGFSCGDRVLYTSASAAYEAKNRFNGLEESVDLGQSADEGFKNMTDAIKATM